MNAEDLGTWLRREREARSWTRAEMARHLIKAARANGDTTMPCADNISHNIYRWERGTLIVELRAYRTRLDALYLEAKDGFQDAEGVLNAIPTYLIGWLAGELGQPDTDESASSAADPACAHSVGTSGPSGLEPADRTATRKRPPDRPCGKPRARSATSAKPRTLPAPSRSSATPRAMSACVSMADRSDSLTPHSRLQYSAGGGQCARR